MLACRIARRLVVDRYAIYSYLSGQLGNGKRILCLGEGYSDGFSTDGGAAYRIFESGGITRGVAVEDDFSHLGILNCDA